MGITLKISSKSNKAFVLVGKISKNFKVDLLECVDYAHKGYVRGRPLNIPGGGGTISPFTLQQHTPKFPNFVKLLSSLTFSDVGQLSYPTVNSLTDIEYC